MLKRILESLTPKLMFEIRGEAFWEGWREGRRTYDAQGHADAQREALIEKVTTIIHGFGDSGNAARALADAGLLAEAVQS